MAPTSKDNPPSELQRVLRDEVLPELQQLADDLPQQLSNVPATEARIRTGFLNAAARLFEAWIAQRTAEPEHATPICEVCSQPMRYKGRKRLRLLTTLGAIEVSRFRWRCETCAREYYPEDGKLRFANHGISPELAKAVSRCGAQLAFEQASQLLSSMYPVELSKQTVQLITRHAGLKQLNLSPSGQQQDVTSDSSEDPAVAWLGVDHTALGGGEHPHQVYLALATALTSDGELLARRCRAAVIDAAECRSVLRELGAAIRLREAACSAVLGNGDPWLWQFFQDEFPQAEQILDWQCACSRLRDAAPALKLEDHESRAQWIAERQQELGEGAVEVAIGNIREQAQAGRKRDRTVLSELASFFTENQGRCQYPRYERLGLPIASQDAPLHEVLLRRRIQRGTDQSWKLEAIEAVLGLRAALEDGSFEEMWYFDDYEDRDDD